MNDLIETIANGYEYYFLHDFFSKIVPGCIFLYPIILIIKPDFILKGLLEVIIFLGLAWISSNATGTICSKIGLIKNKPSGITESAGHELTSEFLKNQGLKLLARRNRYMVIKESTGNLSISFLANIFCVIYLLHRTPESFEEANINVCFLLVVLVSLFFICNYANRIHANKQYAFINQVLKENKNK